MRKVISCIDCEVSECMVKKFCNSEWVEKISEGKQTVFYKSGQHIVYENNPVMGLYFIQSGKAKIFSTGIYGKTQVVRLTKASDIIGHRGFGGELYPIGAVAVENSYICFVDNDFIYKAFMANPKFTFGLMMYYSKELRNSEAKIKNLAQMNVKEKVVDAILYADSVFNEDNNSKVITLNRKDLADLSGINAAQLSRILSELKSENLLRVEINEVEILNSEEMQAIVDPFYKTY